MSYNYGGGPSGAGGSYQGYPYVTQVVIDPPSVSAEDAARWNNLPRRPAPVPKRENGVAGSSASSGSVSTTPSRYQGYPYANAPVPEIPVAITAEDAAKWNRLPRRPAQGTTVRGANEAGGSGSRPQTPSRPIGLQTISQRVQESSQTQREPVKPLSPGPEDDPQPQVFIQVPESTGSQVAERRPVEDDQPYVQDTIFYDPFKDRRIASGAGSSSTTSSSTSERAQRPDTLEFMTDNDGPSGSRPGMPRSMFKEANIYGQIDLPTAFPSRDFPEPPPAYTEMDATSPAQTTSPASPNPMTPMTPVPVVVTDEAGTPTRTQVILPLDGLPEGEARVVDCKSCGNSSIGVVVKKSGTATHISAFLILVLAFPLLLFVYCTDILKYNYYYCRNCNEKVAYKGPYYFQDLRYY